MRLLAGAPLRSAASHPDPSFEPTHPAFRPGFACGRAGRTIHSISASRATRPDRRVRPPSMLRPCPAAFVAALALFLTPAVGLGAPGDDDPDSLVAGLLARFEA